MIEEEIPPRRESLSFSPYLDPPVAVRDSLELMVGTLPQALSLAKMSTKLAPEAFAPPITEKPFPFSESAACREHLAARDRPYTGRSRVPHTPTPLASNLWNRSQGMGRCPAHDA
ncbi:hypothetical protein D6792_00820 [Candidatus Parcubacteria bacterium]|nr:MAG: hypothetical protein D6792_00820 [Candidatus Parcubacteria bacterium]